jgi:hypothetical protein
LSIVKKDFENILNDPHVIGDWHEWLIEWLFTDNLGGKIIDGIIYNKFIFPDRRVIKRLLQIEFEKRGIAEQFYKIWRNNENQGSNSLEKLPRAVKSEIMELT